MRCRAKRDFERVLAKFGERGRVESDVTHVVSAKMSHPYIE